MSSNNIENKNFQVLLVSDMSKVGGTEVATLIAANALKDFVKVVCVFGKQGVLSESLKDSEIKQINAICHTINIFNWIVYVVKMVFVINKYDINIIHSQMARPIPLIWIARLFSKNRKKIKIFWTSRGLKHKSYPKVVPLFIFLGIRSLGNCKKEQEKLIHYGYAREKTTYIYNPYRIIPTEKDIKNLDEKKVTVGTLSALRKDRCVDIFLELASFILRNKFMCRFKFQFVVGGDGECLNELKKLTQNLFISDYVEFLGRVDNVRNFMEKLDIFISPIVMEGDSGAGVSNAIIEAMVMKVPVCAFDTAGISEIVINGKTGFLVEPANISAMSKAIESLLLNEKEREDYINNAYNLVMQECNPKVYVKKLMNLYENF